MNIYAAKVVFSSFFYVLPASIDVFQDETRTKH